MKNNNLCPICGVGKLSRKSEMDEVVYKGVTKHVTANYCVCDHCHVEQAGATELKANKRIMNEFKKEVDGLLTGREVLAIRTSLGITQDQASLVFGGGPNAFTKYENDDVSQSEAMDKIIRMAARFPQVFSELCNLAGVKPVVIEVEAKIVQHSVFTWSGSGEAMTAQADVLESVH
ncbi:MULTISPECIES: type II toxin-antitoxin system MqsA family antitoxin [unclassified Pantoea]|uniref:type II toxin-antitoxin system MqsA family antitoxin n=1 Tax=unclassified Pantoea TaxID=2630326 RepID=UPI001CD505CF|nr:MULTISPECIES: type II toxin-antitoxin system MqsA family antitoxin [unclassified Pantoea]MCA1178902.1 type II toxin-antitoxin system MqsA family antitoxin [Pantoea sp. alder69]MCA1253785.1 type II toxin-antitoxin system MqsA family antitoxin [Pantoea sp. alder70]MCA1267391.1 type II toxin-antitoxin system MqsA family antitoxin [Pantoea sp. alder81]